MPTTSRGDDREIERKYLLRGLPERVATAPAVMIEQGYIPGQRIRERIRRMVASGAPRYYRTLKSGSGMDREEIEDETTEEFFVAVWPLTRGARVYKRRYLVDEGQVVWEIDEFLDRPALWLAEVELERVDQVVSIPDWLSPVLVREVTDEPGFTNRALAR